MELKNLRTELHRLTALVEGWSGPDEIPAVERDLALEKLRTLYEMLRFGDAASTADGEAEQVPLPVAIDLGEMLSLGALSDEEIAGEAPQTPVDEPEVADTPGAGAPEPDGPLSAAPVADVPAVEEPVADEPAEDESAAGESEAAFAEPAPVVEEPVEEEPRAVSEPVVPVADEPAAEYPAAEGEENADPQIGELTLADQAPVEEAAKKQEEEPIAEPAPESAGEPAENPAAEPVSEPAAELAEPAAPAEEQAPAADPNPSSEPVAEHVSARTSSARVAPTLFGLEEQTVRHRHKQRVIMSLYDYDPAAQPASPRPAQPAVPEPAVEEAPAARPSAEDAAAKSDDEVFSVLDVPTAPDTDAAADDESVSVAQTPETVPAPEAAEPEAEEEPAGDDSAAAPVAENVPPRSGAVLGEVINQDVQTLADTIAPPRDIASELRRSEPVTDLRKAIGINDKFLMIRDLFGGDGASYEIAIRALNAFDNLDDCMIYIAEHYAWNANSDGAKLLMELLERKFA